MCEILQHIPTATVSFAATSPRKPDAPPHSRPPFVLVGVDTGEDQTEEEDTSTARDDALESLIEQSPVVVAEAEEEFDEEEEEKEEEVLPDKNVFDYMLGVNAVRILPRPKPFVWTNIGLETLCLSHDTEKSPILEGGCSCYNLSLLNDSSSRRIFLDRMRFWETFINLR